jgi:hypothetical protein
VRIGPAEAPASGQVIVRFAQGEILEAAVSPGGQWLALVLESRLQAGLWLTRLDGSGLRLLDRSEALLDLSWSPDGSRLAYRAALPGERELINRLGEKTVLPALSDQVRLLDAANGQVASLLLADPEEAVDVLGWAQGAALFAASQAAGDRPTLVIRRSGQPETAGVFSLEIESAVLQAVQPQAGVQPGLLAPDGGRLLAADGDDALAVQDWQGGRLGPALPSGRGFSAAWSADGGRVLFTRWDAAVRQTTLNTLDIASGQSQVLFPLEPAGDWRLLSAAPQDAWLAAWRYPGGLYLVRQADGGMVNVPAASGFAGWLRAETLPQRLAFSAPLTATVTVTPTVTITPTITVTPTPTPTRTPGPIRVALLLPLVYKQVIPEYPPVCPESTSSCPVERYLGFQPSRASLAGSLVAAAGNALGDQAPAYDRIYYGLPPNPSLVSVSPARPIPHILVRGVAWQESTWLQFAESFTNPENKNACTLLSFDCGYGLMQITSCMGADGCGWFTPRRVSAEISYNLGAGANFLISKWNGIPYFLGENDHTHPADWYYALIAYNGFGTRNDPNNSDYDPRRPPYLEGGVYSRTYEEKVFGWLAHPEQALASGLWLWRPTRLAEVPRGIFGLSGTWLPPDMTTRPLIHLLYDVTVNNGAGPVLRLENTTDDTQAADILLYNASNSFNRRWLDDSNQPPWFVRPYIRLAPGEQRDIPIAEAFFNESFTGYIRLVATAGVDASLVQPGGLAPGQPAGEAPAACTPLLANGGFESFTSGFPASWSVSSSESYPLADSTWFRSGHYGAYLAGYNNAVDSLSQQVTVTQAISSASLGYAWYVQSREAESAPANDILTLRLSDGSGSLIAALPLLSNQSPRSAWGQASLDLTAYLAPYAGQAVRLTLEGRNNASGQTAFYLDDLSLQVCAP